MAFENDGLVRESQSDLCRNGTEEKVIWFLCYGLESPLGEGWGFVSHSPALVKSREWKKKRSVTGVKDKSFCLLGRSGEGEVDMEMMRRRGQKGKRRRWRGGAGRRKVFSPPISDHSFSYFQYYLD